MVCEDQEVASDPDRVVAAVVFDFDGLMMDTESTLLRSWQYEWQQWGLVLDTADFFGDHGGDLNSLRMSTLERAVGEGFDPHLSHRRRTVFRDELHASLPLLPGISEWIDQATQLGIRLAVASSSPRPWIDEHLGRAGVLDRFEVVATGEEVTRHKPAGDVYALALERLGVAAAQAVAVEDTPHGVAAAHAVGLACVAIPNQFCVPNRVAHADLVLRSAADLELSEALSVVGKRVVAATRPDPERG